MSNMKEMLIETIVLAVVAAILLPVMTTIVAAGNFSGVTAAVFTYLPTFIVLGILIFVVNNALKSK